MSGPILPTDQPIWREHLSQGIALGTLSTNRRYEVQQFCELLFEESISVQFAGCGELSEIQPDSRYEEYCDAGNYFAAQARISGKKALSGYTKSQEGLNFPVFAFDAGLYVHGLRRGGPGCLIKFRAADDIDETALRTLCFEAKINPGGTSGKITDFIEAGGVRLLNGSLFIFAGSVTGVITNEPYVVKEVPHAFGFDRCWAPDPILQKERGFISSQEQPKSVAQLMFENPEDPIKIKALFSGRAVFLAAMGKALGYTLTSFAEEILERNNSKRFEKVP